MRCVYTLRARLGREASCYRAVPPALFHYPHPQSLVLCQPNPKVTTVLTATGTM